MIAVIKPSRKLPIVALIGLVACSSGGGGTDLPFGEEVFVGGEDSPEAEELWEGEKDEEDFDHLDASSEPQDTEMEDVALEDENESEPPKTEKRLFTFRTIAGVSMGANAVTIAAHYPQEFDVVGSMGGYVDFRYLAHMVSYFILGGFCPMEQILANLDHINEANNPLVFCGPVKPTMAYEWEWSFNHFHYDNSGGHWGRAFYFYVMEGFQFAIGNMLYFNEENPLLPPGVSLEWWNGEKDPCKNPAVVGYPYNINKEYNPKGEYNLVTFCDGDSVQCDENTLECLQAKGAYEPDAPHNYPVRFLLAVDYNGNLRRDYGEPVVVNAAERFSDVGTDGCPDAFEDGQGGCLESPRSDLSGDPNDDNFDLINNPSGTEGDFEYEEGEPFEDYGLDGVPAEVAGFADYGEGDGVFTIHPRVETLFEQDARTFFRTAPLDVLKRITWYFDGGIRDAFHALPSTMHLSNALKLRGLEVREFDDFVATTNSILPGVTCEDYINHFQEIDLSAKGLGRNVLVRYGNPKASEAEILAGDGKHVGRPCEIINRLLTFFGMAAFRMPNPALYEDYNYPGRIENTSVWSEALQNRVRYSVSLPPNYDDPARQDERYPLMIFLPGHGMAASAMVQAGVIFNLMMQQGILPRFILLAPEGQCCFVDRKSGRRYCGCEIDGTSCLDPDCHGPHEECAIIPVPKEDLVQECNGGHFFINHRTNRWGDEEAYKVMRFEDALFDMIADVDARYRTRQKAEVEVPVDF